MFLVIIMCLDDFELKIGATVLKRVTSYKYLGIIIDDKLTWKEHIDHVYKNIVKFVGIFYRIKHRLSCETLKMIYFAFVYSRLCYGSEIYGSTYQTHLSKLHILNNKILRILTE